MIQVPSKTDPLSLADLVKQLLHDEIISESDANTLYKTPKGQKQAKQHPLEIIADAKLKKNNGLSLTIEVLMVWLANWSNQDYYQVDPLKIDPQKISEVMSFAFAQRHQILALEVHPSHVVIASDQPFLNHWEADLQHVLKKDIQRVVVKPDDLRKFTVEFYELAHSVNKAGAQTDDKGYTQNFEQLLELGLSLIHI